MTLNHLLLRTLEPHKVSTCSVVSSVHLSTQDKTKIMIVGNKKDQNLNIKRSKRSNRRKANKFNVLWFKNYDGSCTVKTVTREQYNRLMGT